jgi:hypothetical protein
MAITRESIPYGLRDVKVALLDAAGLPGTLVDLPNSQTFEFSDTEDFQDLRGDDKLVAKRGSGSMVEWSLESGGISPEAYCVISGASLTAGGVSPAAYKKVRKLVTAKRPYFWCEGQSMSDSGGDFHCKLPRCIADDSLEGTMADGEFWISSASGTGLASLATDVQLTDLVYEFTQNETALAIAAFVPTH